VQPLVFKPRLLPKVWGGRRLHEALNKPLPAGGAWGESWEVSAHPGHVTEVAEGPLAGLPLPEVCRAHAREVFGDAAPDPFPLLFKFLEVRGRLSVQVHPDDGQAPLLAGEARGKTEAWVVLEADPGALVYAGLRPGVGRADLEEALAADRVTECLHSFSPQPGDCLFLRAGTVHAATGGVLLAEVQQSSDATLRLYDWARPGGEAAARPLHIPQALAAIDWDAGPVEPVPGQPLDGLGGDVRGERLVECVYFRLDRFRAAGAFRSPFAGRLSVWMVLDGPADLCAGGGYHRPCRAGDTVLVPAAAEAVEWQARGPATLLGVTLPAPTPQDKGPR
jgi:mannose-6-phosphate isomerase